MSNMRNEGYGVLGENPDTIIIVLDASGRAQYICEAAPGTATSAAAWRVRKLTYDASTGALTNQQWANGNNGYNNVQTTYASYTYS